MMFRLAITSAAILSSTGCNGLLNWHEHYDLATDDASDAGDATIDFDGNDAADVSDSGPIGCNHPHVAIADAGCDRVDPWLQEMPSNPPARTSGHAMAFDEARGVTVLVRGGDTKQPSDTWVWDGAQWHSCAASLPARTDFGMVYARKWGRTIVFGGRRWSGPPEFSAETWEWDGVAWTNPMPTIVPTANLDRFNFGMAYDDARGVVIQFGGQKNYMPTPTDETWVYDRSTWTQKCAGNCPHPPARWGHAMAYDEQRAVVVLYGGCADYFACTTPLRDTWEWNGSAWTDKTGDGGAATPSGVLQGRMTYDPDRQRVLYIGGYYNELWAWNGQSWSKVPSAAPPAIRTASALSYDRISGRTVLFGGALDGDDTKPVNDTWTFCTP